MKVLVGTPCGGGVLNTQYFLAFIECYNLAQMHKQEIYKQIGAQIPEFDPNNPQHAQGMAQAMAQHTFDIGVYTLGGESLLARGRNHIAQVALTQGWDKLLFIDADGGWSWNDFKAILSSPHPITAGVVPLKVYPNQPHNFETSLNYLPFQEDEKYFDRALRTLASTRKMAEGHGSNYVKVAFTGTAFLCIDTSVLAKMAETTSDYIYPNPSTGQPEVHWAFFDGGPMNGQYYSEDWAFCNKARDLGYDIVIDTNVLLTHTGNHTFRAG